MDVMDWYAHIDSLGDIDYRIRVTAPDGTELLRFEMASSASSEPKLRREVNRQVEAKLNELPAA